MMTSFQNFCRYHQGCCGQLAEPARNLQQQYRRQTAACVVAQAIPVIQGVFGLSPEAQGDLG